MGQVDVAESVGEWVSPLLDRPGAVAGEGMDGGVGWHYGDPTREQRLLAEGLAVVDLSHRSVVTVSGPDRLSWLHSLTTQALAGLPPRTSTEALILSPKGHIEHALHVVDDGETTWLTVEPGTGQAVSQWLRSMQFMLRVDVADRTAEFAVVGEAVRREGVEGEPVAWCDPWPTVAEGSVSYAVVDADVKARSGTSGQPSGTEHPGVDRRWREVIVSRAELAQFVADRPLAGTWAAEALRIAAWRPRLGRETDHRTIPHEVDWLRTAVHMAKGCYRGQETVARVHNLGRPPRRLVMLHLDGSGHYLPAPGVDVLDGVRRVGHLTSSARHAELGPIGLALVKRNLAADAVLQVDGVAASQEVIVAP